MAEESRNLIGKPLLGTEEATIDEKGRILFAKKKRERLGEPFVMALSDLGCLWAFPESSWETVLEGIYSADSNNQARQDFARMLLGSAEDDLRFDRQGRAVVPSKLRDAAKLKGRVVLVGIGDRVEIWAKEEYEAYGKDRTGYMADRRQAFRQAYEQMQSGG